MVDKNDKIRYQNGIVIGNIEDKSSLKNPISKLMVQGFDRTLFKLIERSDPKSIHEVGCGEGRITQKISKKFNGPIRSSDFSTEHIHQIQTLNLLNVVAVEKNIYDLNPIEDHADLIICCEVLEHLDNPRMGMHALKALGGRHYIISVPREPIWRILNMLRGKYLRAFGNTPGHLNHWSKKNFRNFLYSVGFHVVKIDCPPPWIMVLGHF